MKKKVIYNYIVLKANDARAESFCLFSYKSRTRNYMRNYFGSNPVDTIIKYRFSVCCDTLIITQ